MRGVYGHFLQYWKQSAIELFVRKVEYAKHSTAGTSNRY